MASKWFAGYSPFEAGPDHSTLARFEQWVIAHQARTFFDAVLRQIDQDFPTERNQPQIGDTYALRANAAQETLITRVSHTCRTLLGALAGADAAGHTALLADLDQTALFGGSDEVKEYRLTAEQQRSRLATTAVAAPPSVPTASAPTWPPAHWRTPSASRSPPGWRTSRKSSPTSSP